MFLCLGDGGVVFRWVWDFLWIENIFCLHVTLVGIWVCEKDGLCAALSVITGGTDVCEERKQRRLMRKYRLIIFFKVRLVPIRSGKLDFGSCTRKFMNLVI